MTLVRHELRQGRTAFVLWTGCIGALLCACVFLYPEMKGQMAAVGDMFASMGRFTAAFGMDRLDMGTLTGYYAVECGNILGLGGAFYASMTGVCALSREERDRTAELLLTHPMSRRRVTAEKLAAVLAQIGAMDLVLLGLSALSVALIGQAVPWRALLLLHGACTIMHLELGCVCFGLSAFPRRSSAGVGLGLTAMMYFLELLANIAERARPLKYLTAFAYCEGADILSAGRLDTPLVLCGMALATAGIMAAFRRYTTKDIA